MEEPLFDFDIRPDISRKEANTKLRSKWDEILDEYADQFQTSKASIDCVFDILGLRNWKKLARYALDGVNVADNSRDGEDDGDGRATKRQRRMNGDSGSLPSCTIASDFLERLTKDIQETLEVFWKGSEKRYSAARIIQEAGLQDTVIGFVADDDLHVSLIPGSKMIIAEIAQAAARLGVVEERHIKASERYRARIIQDSCTDRDITFNGLEPHLPGGAQRVIFSPQLLRAESEKALKRLFNDECPALRPEVRNVIKDWKPSEDYHVLVEAAPNGKHEVRVRCKCGKDFKIGVEQPKKDMRRPVIGIGTITEHFAGRRGRSAEVRKPRCQLVLRLTGRDNAPAQSIPTVEEEGASYS